MLYNESTGKPKVTHDVFSLEGLIAWLETMPGDGEYDWSDCDGKCMLAQYMQANRSPNWRTDYLKFPFAWRHSVALPSPHTFSAALTRARTALASQSRSEA